MRSRRSSGKVVVFIGPSARLPTTSRPNLVARARSRGMASVAGFRAVLINQARGLLGTPSLGHRSAATANASAQGGQDAAPFLAEDLFERRYQYTSEGRISTAPP